MACLHCRLKQTANQALPRLVGYALQNAFKEELEWLSLQDMITPLGMDLTTQWCKSFLLLPRSNVKSRLCRDPARLNEALILLIHRGSTLTDIFLKLTTVKYLFLIGANYNITT